MNDCDYCSKEIVYLQQFESTDCTIETLDIVFIPEARHVQVRIIDDEKMSLCIGIENRFIYCPMCGKRL